MVPIHCVSPRRVTVRGGLGVKRQVLYLVVVVVAAVVAIVIVARMFYYELIVSLILNALCPQIWAAFPRRKRAAIARRYPSFFSSCMRCFRVSIPPAARPTLLRQMDMGSLTCVHIWVRVVYTYDGGSCRHKQVFTRVDSELGRRDG